MASPAKPAARTPARLRLRQIYQYSGLLFAPAIILFSITGAIQVLGLHEESRDGAYQPPAVIEKLSEVHIHHRYALKPRRPPQAAKPESARPKAPAAPAPPRKSDAPSLASILTKWLFFATAVGLTLSAGLGVWMGLVQSRNKRLGLALIVIGVALPIVLLALQLA